ncbi:MAG: hypothetical protein KatS3mg103_1299 [Phycisphaerales bacterium]|nr:MAG: hypothetical protein KatS3mg103_1299 [Phycisphaerales bacterium]
MRMRAAALCVVATLALAGMAASLLPTDAGAQLVQAGRHASARDLGLVFADPLPEGVADGTDQAHSTDGPVDADVAFANRLSRVFRHAARTIEPSVIHIQTARRISRAVRDPFGRIVRRQEETLPAGVGSGVIVTADGYALTNHHVVQGADEVMATLSDGRTVRAEVVGSDAGTDLAVLKLEASGLTPARIADSDRLEVGDWVVAVGSPFGLDHTVTAGIVSAKGRSGLTPRSALRQRVDRFEEFIQTDAAINPGNSGGPLVNLHGELVGINSMIASSSGGSVGIGFAIPSAIATSVFENIRLGGRLEQGFLGVSDLVDTAEIAAETGQDLPEGVYVQNVIEGGPADRAGLRPGDIITAINGRKTENFIRLRNLVGLTRPGTPVTIEVVRDGKVLQLPATVTGGRELAELRERAYRARHEAERRALEQAIEQRAQDVPAMGIRGLTIDDSLPVLFPGMPSQGVLVLDVQPDTPAQALGITKGDVILGINGRPVTSAKHLQETMQNADLRSGVRVEYVSGGRRQSAVVRLRE